MSEKERKNYLNLTIWFNLLIGLYNLYIFNEVSSIFHLILGTLNIGIWVFNRHQVTPVVLKISKIDNKN